MKVKFWKHTMELFFSIFISILTFIFTIIAIIFTIKDITNYWPMLMCALLMFLVCMYLILIEKRTLSKVLFSEEGIECIRFKKQIVFINWSEITDVKETVRSSNMSWLTFVVGNKQISMELTQKMYNAIMALCPYANIKFVINDIYCFRGFHRKKKEKK